VAEFDARSASRLGESEQAADQILCSHLEVMPKFFGHLRLDIVTTPKSPPERPQPCSDTLVVS